MKNLADRHVLGWCHFHGLFRGVRTLLDLGTSDRQDQLRSVKQYVSMEADTGRPLCSYKCSDLRVAEVVAEHIELA